MATFLKVKGVEKKLPDRILLDKVDFDLQKSEKLGIVGETGSGKTTLLKIIGGLIQPSSGDVFFKDERVLGPEDQLIAGHPSIGYLSQHFELPKFITVEDYIFDSYKISEEDVNQLYETCDIMHLIDKDTRALSGGEKQRVALARILRDEPELLLLDEPFSNLDLNHQRIIKAVLSNLEGRFNTTLIIVSHDPHDILSWADNIFVMKAGRVVQSGQPKTLYYKPKDEYVAGLFGDYNLLKAGNVDGVPEISSNGSYLIRPGAIRLCSANNGIRGRVVETRFVGSHDEVIIDIKSQNIKALDTAGKWSSGDVVYAQFGAEDPVAKR